MIVSLKYLSGIPELSAADYVNRKNRFEEMDAAHLPKSNFFSSDEAHFFHMCQCWNWKNLLNNKIWVTSGSSRMALLPTQLELH